MRVGMCVCVGVCSPAKQTERALSYIDKCVRTCVCAYVHVSVYLVSYNETQTRKLESLYALGRDKFDFAQVLSPPHDLPAPTLALLPHPAHLSALGLACTRAYV